ncbi:hypothetical protein tb265_15370 [Gemmatimonadetes bacterium T265]|nr:hypothetical protein tb265_15370 [Gemmatimonadetes bacterium T265]
MSDQESQTPRQQAEPQPRGVSRRDALRVLGLAAGGVAAAACTPEAPPAASHAHGGAATAAGPPSTRPGLVADAFEREEVVPGLATPFFTPRERETVNVLVDYVIPRDERSGSATEAGVPAWMDQFLAHPDTEPHFRLAVRGGLGWLNAESGRRWGVSFARATDAQRRAILDDIAYPKRARPEMRRGVAFFNTFRDFTASGFFSSQVGWKDLQYQGNVARPSWDGCPPEAVAKLGVGYELMATRVTPASGKVRV